MTKECTYCGTVFQAARSDAKYCSKTCKNEAYLARKASIESDTGHNMDHISKPPMNHTMTNRNYQNQNPYSPQPQINQVSEKMLEHLLSEKDNSGDFKSQTSELRIKLMFIERDLQQAEKRVAELESENQRLTDKVEDFEDSGINKIIAFCEKNPSVLFPIITKLTGQPVTVPAAEHIGGLNRTPGQEEAQEEAIYTALERLSKVYENPVSVLVDLSLWAEKNIEMAKALLSQIRPVASP